MMAGSMAIVKLKATDEALSVKPVLRACKKKESYYIKKRNALETGQKNELAFPDQEAHGPGYQEPSLQPRKKMHVHLIFRLFSSW